MVSARARREWKFFKSYVIMQLNGLNMRIHKSSGEFGSVIIDSG